ncbi:peptidylprolyl isomerase [Arenibaculum pallidiluteum]|uniref:peptidylprolyl isomerase n=1 Tax=Arenibaculum pallidiluteum TaxID=2812559 RepID=UPI001F1A6BA0|nr:peptidylprolyl isomerase [Arenibaculum pallidiluteum]
MMPGLCPDPNRQFTSQKPMPANLPKCLIRIPVAAALLAAAALPASAQFTSPATRSAQPPAVARPAAPQAAPQAAPPAAPQASRPAAPPAAAAPAPGAPPTAMLRPPPSGAPSMVERIAAVVNDEIVSLSDLEARLQLALLSAGLPDSPEARQRLAPQVLRQLVDERLQLQEAKRLNVRVTDKELDDRLGRLAQQNRMTQQQMGDFLKARGISPVTLREQTRAVISWEKLIQRRLRPQVEIGDEEIDAYLQRIQANAGKPEYLVAEIFLAVDSPEQDEEVHRLADRLTEQIVGGASFSAVARQFSQSAVAAQGGDLGWVQQDQLPGELDQALRQLRPGQISRPIRGISGYHLLMLRDQRLVSAGNPADAKVTLKQLLLPRVANQDAEGLRAEAEKLRPQLTGCEAMGEKATALGSPQSGDAGTLRLGDMPQELAQLVAGLNIGEPSPPLLNESGAMIVMVCGRELPAGSLPSREEVLAVLGTERLDMLQRRWLRDLRRSAFVDVRV